MPGTHEKIIQAAKELFEKDGFAATTTRAIANHAGISEVTLFRHFKTKRNLFEQTVKSCMHPYKLQTYLENDVTYDLDHDLMQIAYNMLETYQQNIPLLKMIFKDKMGGMMRKMHLKDKEHDAKCRLMAYFSDMNRLGKMNADPEMAFKFFMSNITGFFIKDMLSTDQYQPDEAYFKWMIDKIIVALKNETN